MTNSQSKQKKIIHIDQDCFYAAVEIRDNPTLKGLPVAVGGSASGRGVLTTASYEARKFGVRSAMSTSQALRLCPQLVLVPVNFEKYKVASQAIRNVFLKFTDKVQPLSLDEAYLDVSSCTEFNGSATLIAKEIRAQIFKETQLTASAGIAPNKFLAKIASDWNKPNGQFTIRPDMVAEFVKKLTVEKIPGVGKVTAKKMHSLDIKTCLDLQNWSLEDLNFKFGVWGLSLYDLCRGRDDREVKNNGKRKSLSVESTYASDLSSLEDCLDKLPKLYEEFENRLDRAKISDQIQALVVKVKFDDFTQTTFERSDEKTPSLDIYTKMIEQAFVRVGKPVRLLGLGVKLNSKKIIPKTPQLSLFDIEKG